MRLLLAAVVLGLATPALAQTVGEIVYLKSGSVPMVVVSSNQKDGITTQWMSGATVSSATFPASALVPVDPKPALDHERAKAEAQLEIDDPLPKVEPVP